ncbi:hypothetical protein ASPFODRAFT_39566 [Aspergillus luchuensis CBS 106.47]|uniref:Uncharacterized protein n=1 Tax=Aspergillus luchuensis (strain CBS 106.47) TaxID=1137211 RepID=A0A1M3TZR1_ASPLC|nr:hypothetical protein ASPFODRAFT_39566 [Aspergillus luchuensis CBS 106.47]
MPTFSRKPRKPRARMKTGGTWTDEEKQRFWDQRTMYSRMPWREFRKQFFPHRSQNALEKAYSMMSIERRREANISNPYTPRDPPPARIVTLRTRTNKRALPDEMAPGNRPGKQTRTAAVLSSGKDQVEETDQNNMTDEDTSSDYEQDSDEETLQGPSLPYEREGLDGIETIVIDDTNNAPENRQSGEEEAGVGRTDAQGDTDMPDSRPNGSTGVSSNKTPPAGSIPGRTSMTPSSRSGENQQGHQRSTKEATEPTRPSLPSDVQYLKNLIWRFETTFFKNYDQEKVIASLQCQIEDLKKINSDKTAKLESAQEESRRHTQTIKSLEQRELKYRKEIYDLKNKLVLSDQRATIFERKVAVARSMNKCETCLRVAKIVNADADESSNGPIS